MKKRLFSDRKLTRDSNGRIRIGGKFASKRQVGRYKAARTRRGLQTKIVASSSIRPRKSTKTPSRSLAGKKGSLTRQLNERGAEFVREFRTPEANFLKREWLITVADGETIQLVIDRELLGIRKSVLINAIMEGSDDEGNDVIVSTPFANAREEGAGQKVADDLGGLASQYQFAITDEILLVFSFAR